MPLSEELGQGSELRLLHGWRHMFHGMYGRPISVEGDGGGWAEPATRSVRAAEPVVGEKGFKAESALVDQMELPKGVVVDHGLEPFPRSDAVGAVGELELLGQECRGSLLCISQMEGGETVVNSDQLC